MKKFIGLAVVMLLGLFVIFYGACILVSNLKYDIGVSQKQSTTLQKQMTKIKNENKMLKNKTQMQAFGGKGIIQQAELISNEKDKNNAVYGKFNLKVTVKNNNKTKINNLRVIAQLVITDRTTSSGPETTIKYKNIPYIAPGATQEVTFTDFSVGTPSQIHELYISASGYSDIKKITVKVTTPPSGMTPTTKQRTTSGGNTTTRTTTKTTTKHNTTQTTKNTGGKTTTTPTTPSTNNGTPTNQQTPTTGQ